MKHDQLAGYARKTARALRELNLASTYAEDGAQLDAVRHANLAITLLMRAYAQKNLALMGLKPGVSQGVSQKEK